MTEHLEPQDGMELRDWFAGLAMHAVLSNSKVLSTCEQEAEHEDIPTKQVVAEIAYAQADHMLAASTAELTEGDPEQN
jgi:Flp pilus assembly protein CpaB